MVRLRVIVEFELNRISLLHQSKPFIIMFESPYFRTLFSLFFYSQIPLLEFKGPYDSVDDESTG